MAIVIKTEKYVNNSGEEGRKILEVQALRTFELPTLYVKDDPYCYMNNNGNTIEIHTQPSFTYNITIHTNDFFPENKFQEAIGQLKICGEKLCQINKELKEKRENWKGEETFII